jgi:hypothetical protein
MTEDVELPQLSAVLASDIGHRHRSTVVGRILFEGALIWHDV